MARAVASTGDGYNDVLMPYRIIIIIIYEASKEGTYLHG